MRITKNIGEVKKRTWNFVYTKTPLKTANVWSISVSQVMFLTHDLSNVSDDFRGTYHVNKKTSNIAWRHFTSHQFFPFDWYNLNLSQEKKNWRVNRSRRLKDQNNIALMTPLKVQYFSWPWNRCWLNVAFVYSVWQYNQKSKAALNIALNNLSWKLTVSANLFTLKICLRLNPIFTEMAYKINKIKYTVDTIKSSKIHNSTFI